MKDFAVGDEHALADLLEPPRADVDEQTAERQADRRAAAVNVAGRFAEHRLEVSTAVKFISPNMP